MMKTTFFLFQLLIRDTFKMGTTQSGMICTRGGGSPVGPQQCPPGTVMTGAAWRHGAAVDRLQGIWCKDAHKVDEIDNDNNTKYYKLDWGGNGGNAIQTRCPKGYAVKGVDMSLGSSYVGGVTLKCAPFLPKDSSKGRWNNTKDLPMVGRKYPDKNQSWVPGGKTSKKDKWYVTGVEGRSGKMLDCVGWYASDFGPIYQTRWNEKAQAECCSGKNTNSAVCGPYKPGSGPCTNVFKSYCTKSDNIASNDCQNFCRENKTIECDNAMIEYCRRQKDAGNSPELCNCINSQSLAPQCWDPMCSQTAAYQTLNQQTRQDCGVFCSQEINVAETEGDVGIDRTLFEQKCGRDAAKRLEDAINPPPADDPETAALEEEIRKENPTATEEEIQEAKQEVIQSRDDKTSSTYIIIIIVAILVFLLVIGGGGLWLFLRRIRR